MGMNLFENETAFQQLMIKAQVGDRDAYYQLLSELNSFLSNYLRKRIFDHNEIEDVSQKILLAVHKSLNTYNKDKSFMSWLIAITEYKIIDYIRSLKKHSSLADSHLATLLPSSVYMNTDLKIDIDRAISSLSAKEKTIFTMLKIEEQPVSEVAKKLNLSEANVKVIAHRACINLKLYLGPQR